MSTVGRLEICYDGQWRSLCDDFADDMIATVVCRELGHAANGWKTCIVLLHIYYIPYIYILGSVFSVNDFNATIPVIPTILKEVVCIGNETNILECFQGEARYHLCYHFEDIAIQCTGTHLL